MPQEFWLDAVYSIAPTLVVAAIFWFAMRSVLRADRGERRVYSRIEAEERAKAASEARPS